MINTGVICMVFCGEKSIDLGNYFDMDGEQVLVTSEKLAKEYGHLVEVPIYIKNKKGSIK